MVEDVIVKKGDHLRDRGISIVALHLIHRPPPHPYRLDHHLVLVVKSERVKAINIVDPRRRDDVI